MVQLALAFVALTLASVHASPILEKRIAQVIIDAVEPWENACNKAGGGGQCNSMAVAAAETLLAAAGNCDQQNSADQFVTFAKTLSNPSQMISLAQIFVQQPRNTPDSLAVPYCDQAPVNSELDGLFQCQYQGADLSQFVGGLSVGQKGTIPFGHDGPVTPPGSCFAHTGGPISSGSQLVDIITSPNAPNGASPGSGGSAVATAGSAGTTNSDPNPTNSTTSVALTVPPASSATSAFQTANGQAAQGLNAHFATLTDDSPCTDGEQACVNGAFAQCEAGKFVTQPCASPTTCLALPLVNKPGTSITCDTQSDAEARMKSSGVQGGLTG